MVASEGPPPGEVSGLRTHLHFLQNANDLLFRESRSFQLSILPTGGPLINQEGEFGAKSSG
jgi:hypothetical protein